MYYDDEARRFNFLSGLLLGTVLGTGLALLVRSRHAGGAIAEAIRAAEREGLLPQRRGRGRRGRGA